MIPPLGASSVYLQNIAHGYNIKFAVLRIRLGNGYNGASLGYFCVDAALCDVNNDTVNGALHSDISIQLYNYLA